MRRTPSPCLDTTAANRKSPWSRQRWYCRLLFLGTLQVLVEPVNRAPQRVNLVLSLGEAVPLVGIVMSIHDLASFLESRDSLLCFLGRIANIIFSLQNQYRDLGLFEVYSL